MKKTARNILIMLAVLVVLGGAAAILLLTQPKAEEESSSTPSETASAILQKESADIAGISVKNSEGSFRIVPDSKNSNDFTLEGYEKYDVNLGTVNDSVDGLISLVPTKELGRQENLEEYGLAGDSAVDVTLEYTDGGGDHLVLGSKGGESAGRYVLVNDAVYIVGDISDNLYGSVYNYFSSYIYAVPEQFEETEESSTEGHGDPVYHMNHVTLSGSHFPEEISIERDETLVGEYRITKPFTAESGSTKFNDMVTSLKSLTATKVVKAGITDQVLEEYGLKEPYAKIEFNLNDEEHTLAVSERDNDGNRYLIADETDLVYQVTDNLVSAWAETKLLDLRMSYVWLPNITGVSRLSLTLEGDMAYAYTVTREQEEDSSGSSDYILTVKNAGGKEIDYDTCYQPFYRQLLGIAVLSTEKAEYGDTPDLRVEFSFFEDGKEDDTVEYYAVGSDRYAAVLNGEYSGLVRKSELDKVIDLIPQLDSNTALK